LQNCQSYSNTVIMCYLLVTGTEHIALIKNITSEMDVEVMSDVGHY